MRRAVLGLAVALGGLGVLGLPALPATVGPVQLVPVLLCGIALALEGSAGAGMGVLSRWFPRESPVYVGVFAIGAVLVTTGAVGLAKLAPLGDIRAVRLADELPGLCHGPPDVRADRRIVPVLAGLAELPHETVRDTLDTHLPRCAAQVEQAWQDPDGVHRSWRQVRRRLSELGAPANVDGTPPVRAHRPARPQADLDL